MAPRLLLAVFIALQAADGLLTYSAVTIFGHVAEGNPLLVTWMAVSGSGPALFGAKLLACACGGVLYALGVHQILAGLTALYLFGAVVPWIQVIAAIA